ncbi:DUF2529 family protein [Pontibacillus salicampi]|uniref:DUF2529 family protein n=1 Tax=Pontibacillus salicampi TaxID=1449801 RepID=A0ABV6LS17_9BACI
MLTTQLTGTFQSIQRTEEEHIEDAARALAQSIVGDGRVYIKGFGEMEAIHHEIKSGPESLPDTSVYSEDVTLHHLDRVVVFSRFANDEEALAFTRHVQEQGVEVIQISAATKEENPLKDTADFHIDTKVTGPMLPLDMERVGFPTLMGMLYIYYALFVTTKEIISEYE